MVWLGAFAMSAIDALSRSDRRDCQYSPLALRFSNGTVINTWLIPFLVIRRIVVGLGCQAPLISAAGAERMSLGGARGARYK
jgi:hypothetical protein